MYRCALGAYECAIALARPEKEVVITEGSCQGMILTERRGTGGFGYDPLFYIPDQGCTMAELNPDVKKYTEPSLSGTDGDEKGAGGGGKMMRIGLVSDSHGNVPALKRAIRALGEINLLVHLGDGAGDAEATGLKLPEFIQLKGNCDLTSELPREEIRHLGMNFAALFCHGDEWGCQVELTTIDLPRAGM